MACLFTPITNDVYVHSVIPIFVESFFCISSSFLQNMAPVAVYSSNRIFDDLILEGLEITDYTLSNPDTLTKYKTAAQISHKVLEAVSGERWKPQVLSIVV